MTPTNLMEAQEGQADQALDVIPAARELVPVLDTAQLFERWATDPNVSVEKIERLMAMFERGEAKKAEMAFNVAMSTAQRAMRPVAADATNPQTRSRYASYEALDLALRPIYTAHGFALSFNSGETSLPEHVRVLCKVTHAGGHAEPYHIDMPADGKGAKGGDVMTKTHAVASAVSYGMRYLLKMIFNVAVGEDDDDGNRAGAREAVAPPDGFVPWWAVLSGIAKEGFPSLDAAWQRSNGMFKTYVSKYRRDEWEALKSEALKVRR